MVGDKHTGFKPQLSGRDFSVYVVTDDVKILPEPTLSEPSMN